MNYSRGTKDPRNKPIRINTNRITTVIDNEYRGTKTKNVDQHVHYFRFEISGPVHIIPSTENDTDLEIVHPESNGSHSNHLPK